MTLSQAGRSLVVGCLNKTDSESARWRPQCWDFSVPRSGADQFWSRLTDSLRNGLVVGQGIFTSYLMDCNCDNKVTAGVCAGNVGPSNNCGACNNQGEGGGVAISGIQITDGAKPCTTDCCAGTGLASADVDGTGCVEVNDLLIVLSSWGCP